MGKKTTTRGIVSASLTNPGRICGVSMDKALSRRISAEGNGFAAGANRSNFASLTYRRTNRKPALASPARAARGQIPRTNCYDEDESFSLSWSIFI